MDTVKIFDTTLRDGEQAPGASLNEAEKMEVARALQRLGVDIIEAGFPVSSPGDFASVQNIAREIKGVTICGLARSIKKDIDAAYDAVKVAESGRVHVFVATSKIHLQHKLKKDPEAVLDMAVDAVKYAKEKIADVEFSPEDASRTEPEFLYRILEAVIKAGATTVNIPDTVGYANPEEYGQLITGIMNHVPNINKAVVSVHCHDDLGLGVANSLAAVKHGARQVECTINGIGERAGNAAMEEVVMALKTRADYFGVATRINTREIARASRLVSKLTGFPVPPNKAIVGANAFAHESGIHQHGILSERSTYEIMQAEDVGVVGCGLVLGKHSGRHAFKARLTELGFDLDEEKIDQAFERFKQVADKKKEVYDEDLRAIVEDEARIVEPVWTLEDLTTTSGSKSEPRVDVELRSCEGEVKENSSTGDGPVDACYKAIDEITSVPGTLMDYSLRSVTRGKDAMGEVTVRVKFRDRTVIAHGVSTDIIVASAKAYLNALNKVIG
ncbi:MAG: 2-isopropylmalate synthase [Candidatus Omnitrophota bacterium]